MLSAGDDQTLSVLFTPNDSVDFNDAVGTAAINVDQVTPSLTWATPAPIVYGTALSVTQLNATASVPGMLTYTPAAGTVLGAGTGQELSVSFTPTDSVDFTGATDSVMITVTKAKPTITWANPAAITFGTPLSVTQLDATASVPGMFTYTPAAGTVLDAGTHQGAFGELYADRFHRLHDRHGQRKHYGQQGHANDHLGRPGRYHLRDRPVR